MESSRKKRYREKVSSRKYEKRVRQFSEFEDNLHINSTESSDASVDNNVSESNLTDLTVPVDSISSHNSNSSSECDTQNKVLNSDNTSSDEEFIMELDGAKEIGQLREWAVSNKVSREAMDKLLKILKPKILPSLPSSTKTLLKCVVDLSNIEDMTVSNNSVGEFKYFSISDGLLNQVDVSLHDSQVLELIINIDGMSPFKSSSISVWPILVKVYTTLDLYPPFTAAIYSGNGKPKYCEEYLKKFVVEMNHLLRHGILVQEKLFKVEIKFFVCDSPARSFLKCVVGHVAFNGCERCEVLGEKVDSVTVFLQRDAERRTNEKFRTFENPNCHTAATPLCAIKELDLVSQFILDPMHLLYLGCTERILKYLLSASTNKVRISPTLKAELVRRTALIQTDIPIEFPRKMRSTQFWTQYKAVEFKFFALYAAPIVCKKLLSEDVYNNLMLFTTACRLLSDKKNLQVERARQYFTKFVEEATVLYGQTFVSLNVHNLIHIADDVQTTGCSLSELSAFAFESYLGTISAVLRSSSRIIPQYCRRLQEKKEFTKEEITVPPEIEILLEKKKVIQRLKYKGWTIATKHPNQTVLLKGGVVAEVYSFNTSDPKNILIEVKKYLKKKSLFKYPCLSNELQIFEVTKLKNDIVCLPLAHVEKKLVRFQINFSKDETERFFVVPLLH